MPKQGLPIQPVNVSGASIRGVEAAIINGASFNLPLVNLSKWTVNATLYYDWGIRVSEAYRGKYLNSAGANGNVGEGYDPTHNVDFAAHYNITPRSR